MGRNVSAPPTCLYMTIYIPTSLLAFQPEPMSADKKPPHRRGRRLFVIPFGLDPPPRSPPVLAFPLETAVDSALGCWTWARGGREDAGGAFLWRGFLTVCGGASTVPDEAWSAAIRALRRSCRGAGVTREGGPSTEAGERCLPAAEMLGTGDP